LQLHKAVLALEANKKLTKKKKKTTEQTKTPTLNWRKIMSTRSFEKL
jgi:hypothetical protein